MLDKFEREINVGDIVVAARHTGRNDGTLVVARVVKVNKQSLTMWEVDRYGADKEPLYRPAKHWKTGKEYQYMTYDPQFRLNHNKGKFLIVEHRLVQSLFN